MVNKQRVRVMTSKKGNENEEEHVNPCPWCGKTEVHTHYKDNLTYKWPPLKIGETRCYQREEWDVGHWLPKHMGWDIYLSQNVRSKK